MSGDIIDDSDAILGVLESDSWTELVNGLRHSKAYLHETVPGSPIPKKLIERITSLAGHTKWEVRKACAEALGIVVTSKATIQLHHLSNDPVSYVSQAAEKSLREAKRVTTKIYEKRDPTGERLFALIKRLNPHNIRESYAAALQVGQIYYRELAGITTHELRTSLYCLSGLISDLVESAKNGDIDDLDAQQADIQKAMDGLIRLTTCLTDLTRESKIREVFEVVPVIHNAINEAVNSQTQIGALTPTVIPLGLWGDAKLIGDPALLGVAIRNLIINAFEASSQDGKVIVTLDSDNTEIIISIQDEGPGMTDQQIDAAFKPFNSSKDGNGGTGFGVPVANKIVHFDFDGALIYQSELGKGTRVDINLPIYQGGDN